MTVCEPQWEIPETFFKLRKYFEAGQDSYVTSTVGIPYISERGLFSSLGSQSKSHPQLQSYECVVSLMCKWSYSDREKNRSFIKKVFGPKPENTLEK